jgi:phenylalanyl-tRNA synthetase beta chain
MLFELDIDLLKPLPSRTNKFAHIPEYPITNYDVSSLFDLKVKWEQVLEVIMDDSSGLLRGVSFVDEYRGHQVPDGKKSVTFRLVIGSQNKTLTSNEIESCAGAIVGRLNKAFGAVLRS